MKFRKMIFVLVIATSIIFIGMIGSSYAYYTLTGGTNLDVTTGTFDSNISVVFNQSQYINLKTGVPISSADVDTYANKSVFTLVPNSTVLGDYEAAVNIGITNIVIDDALKVADFNYDLNCNDGTNNINLGSGTGESITDTNIIIGTLSTTNNTFNANNTYTCTLRFWLLETGADQNALMNKKFSGLIKVSSMYKK